MKVVLSIKPEFAFKIFDGTKKFEFRKTIFKNNNVTSVIVYASSPVKKVIGEFEIEKIFNKDLETLWNLTKDHSGITEDFFMSIFRKGKKDLQFKLRIKKNIKTQNV